MPEGFGRRLPPELRVEIEDILRQSDTDLTHGEVFRYQERGLSLEEMAMEHGTTVGNLRSFQISLEHLFDGTIPGSASGARRNAMVYKELLNHSLSPELQSYVMARLRDLQAVNTEINFKPLRGHAGNKNGPSRRPADPRVKDYCLGCQAVGVLHRGQC